MDECFQCRSGVCRCPDQAKADGTPPEQLTDLILELAERRDLARHLAQTAPKMPLRRAYRASLEEAYRSLQAAINSLKEAEGFYGFDKA